MIGLVFKLKGDLESGLGKLEDQVKESILISGAAAMASVEYAELKIQTSPPKIGRVTGNLNEAVYRVYSKDRSSDSEKVYHIGVNRKKAPHFHLIEYGTVNMTARAPVRKSFDRIQEAIEAGQKRMAERYSEL